MILTFHLYLIHRGSDPRKGGMWKTKISRTIQIENKNVTQLILIYLYQVHIIIILNFSIKTVNLHSQ